LTIVLLATGALPSYFGRLRRSRRPCYPGLKDKRQRQRYAPGASASRLQKMRQTALSGMAWTDSHLGGGQTGVELAGGNLAGAGPMRSPRGVPQGTKSAPRQFFLGLNRPSQFCLHFRTALCARATFAGNGWGWTVRINKTGCQEIDVRVSDQMPAPASEGLCCGSAGCVVA